MKKLLFALSAVVSLTTLATINSVSMRANAFIPYVCDYTMSMYGTGTNLVNATGISTIMCVDDEDVAAIGTNNVDIAQACIIDTTRAQTVFVHARDGNPLYCNKDPTSTKVFLSHSGQMVSNVVLVLPGQILRIDRVSPNNFLYSIISPATQTVDNVSLPTNLLNSVTY